MPLEAEIISIDEQRAKREARSGTPEPISQRDERRSPFSSQSGIVLTTFHANALAEQVRPEDNPKGLAESFVKTCQRWKLDWQEQAVLLGYKGNESSAKGILAGTAKIPSQDVRDRMAYIVGISLTLGAQFKEEAESEIAWLRANRSKLKGRSALGVLLNGHIADLLTVVNLLRDEGRP